MQDLFGANNCSGSALSIGLSLLRSARSVPSATRPMTRQTEKRNRSSPFHPDAWAFWGCVGLATESSYDMGGSIPPA